MKRAPIRIALSLAVVWAAASCPAAAEPRAAPRPEHRWVVDAPLLGTGAACYIAAIALEPDLRSVPPEGLDPSAIRWRLDRDALGNLDPDARSMSNGLLAAAVVWPVALAAASAPPGERLRATADRAVLLAESMFVAHGFVSILKVGVSRPRPFTYAPESARPEGSHYDAAQAHAFYSLPSGHATTVWCAAAFAVTDNLLSRPGAGWVERVVVSFTGAALATTTAALRVEAGQHFPTDVLAGAAIGAGCGAGVPLAHRWFADGARVAPPPARGWLQAGAGALAGVGAGLLLASAFAD